MNLQQNIKKFSTYTLIYLIQVLTLILLLINNLVYANVKTEKVLAITAIVDHPALEEAKAGALSVLEANGYKIGVNLKIIEQNAQNSIANALLISKHFINTKPDAILAISTPSAQSLIKLTKNNKIPLVFTSVTDPISSGLVQDLNNEEELIGGSIDSAPIDELLLFIKTLLPNTRKIGVLYNAGESNSYNTINLLKKIAHNKYQIIESTVHGSSGISQNLYNLIEKGVDVIYLPSDNTIFSSMQSIVNIVKKYNIPTFVNESKAVEQGIFASIGYSQYDVGIAAGEILLKVFQGDKKLKVIKPQNISIIVNKNIASKLQINIPKKFLGKDIMFFD